MSELTKEYLDKKLENLVTKDYFEQTLDKRFNEFEAKFDQKLSDQTDELKSFAEEQTESLARIIQTSVVEPMEKRFEKLENRLESSLHSF